MLKVSSSSLENMKALPREESWSQLDSDI
jgi:hypothetical protein